MSARRVEGEGRRETPGDAGTDLSALVTLLARALDLEQAVLVVEGAAVASCGPPPTTLDPAAWTLALPVRSGARAVGSLLVRGRRGASVDAEGRQLAERLAASLAQILEAGHLAADLARTRELLARADRLSALGTLSAGVAHEIRNPLVSVRTFIQLLPERLGDEEFRTGFRDLALGEIERICGLINDLLAFSRPAPSAREPTDLNDLVAQIARLLDAEARRRDVGIACRVDPTLPLVVVDEAQVKQVLMNVILNAIQACPPHGCVEITTRAEERPGARWCAVVIADSGSGIAPEHLEHIFDPFFTTKDAGSGLGLFIAREIVGAHGGEIRAVPRAEGGTEFSIQFPLERQVADADAV